MKVSDLPRVQAVLKVNGKNEFVILNYDRYKRLILGIMGVEGQIDEAEYFKKYPDVEKAVLEGRLLSATDRPPSSGPSAMLV